MISYPELRIIVKGLVEVVTNFVEAVASADLELGHPLELEAGDQVGYGGHQDELGGLANGFQRVSKGHERCSLP
jgi:hypothetical protein